MITPILYSLTRRDTIYGIRLFPLLIIIFTLLAITACDKRNFQDDKETYSIVSFSTNSTTLYDDGGATSITLEAVVHDNLGRAVPNQSIRFSADITQIQFETISSEGEQGGGGFIDPSNRFVTDGNGKVKANAKLSGKVLSQNADSLYVNMSVWLNYESRPQHSIRFTLYKEPGIARIILNIGQIPSTVRIGQRVELIARPYDTLDAPVTDGVRVMFVTTDRGYFEDELGIRYDSQIEVACSTGFAKTTWVTGTSAGVTTLYAKIGEVYSESKDTTIQEASPGIIVFAPHTDSIPVNTPGIQLSVEVSDTYGNLCSGRIVNFTSKNEDNILIGEIFRTAMTDSIGVATTFFTPGRTAGNAIITATCGDSASAVTMIRIEAVVGHYLQFEHENPIILNVAGTGGVDSQSIGVIAYDAAQNLVTAPNFIKFTVLNAPSGVKIDNLPWSPTTSVINTTYGGIAHVYIASGIRSGTVSLKAELLYKEDPDDPDSPLIGFSPPVSVEKRNILIHAGPAAFGDLFVPTAGSEVMPAGAGSWKWIVAAHLTDIYLNPILPGTGVTFRMEHIRRHPDATEYYDVPTDSIGSSPANINATAWVGNTSAYGDSTAGVAFTYIIFHSKVSGCYVDIYIDLADTTLGPYVVKLPLSGGLTISVLATPEIIQWEAGDTTDWKFTTIRVMVGDGYGVGVPHVPLLFTANGGSFNDNPALDSFRDADTVAYVQQQQWENPTEYELWDYDIQVKPITPFEAPTNLEGVQLKRFYYPFTLFNFNDPVTPREMTVTISVQVPGVENTTQSLEIILRNWN